MKTQLSLVCVAALAGCADPPADSGPLLRRGTPTTDAGSEAFGVFPPTTGAGKGAGDLSVCQIGR